MPRLRNKANGAFVNVSDETAARLSPEWEPAEVEKPKRAKSNSKSDS